MAFGRRGDRVALLARGSDKLAATALEVGRAGGRPLVVACDVSDPEAVDSAARRVEAELGEIDVWVNDAMTAVLAYSWEIAPEDYRRVMEVNYLGFVHGTLAALRHMRPRDRGTIVQVGSALAHRAIPLQATYCASKFAIRGFTDSLRCELRHGDSNVRLTMVQMPGLNTPQFTWVRTTLRRRPKPVAPVYQPEDRGARGRVGVRAPASRAVRRRQHRRGHLGQSDRPVGRRPLPGPDEHHRPAGPRRRRSTPRPGPTISTSRCPATTAPTAHTTTAPTHGPRSSSLQRTAAPSRRVSPLRPASLLP